MLQTRQVLAPHGWRVEVAVAVCFRFGCIPLNTCIDTYIHTHTSLLTCISLYMYKYVRVFYTGTSKKYIDV